MQVFVRGIGDGTQAVSISLSDTVETLQSKVQTKTNIYPNGQLLFTHNGKPIHKDRALSHSNIENESSIHVHFLGRGGDVDINDQHGLAAPYVEHALQEGSSVDVAHMPGDNSCLFHALAFGYNQLYPNNTPLNGMELRSELAIAHLYDSTIIENAGFDGEPNAQYYTQRMLDSSEWGGDVEVRDGVAFPISQDNIFVSNTYAFYFSD